MLVRIGKLVELEAECKIDRPGVAFAEPVASAAGEVEGIVCVRVAALIEGRGELGDPVEALVDGGRVAEAGLELLGDVEMIGIARIAVAQAREPVLGEVPVDADAEAGVAGDEAFVLIARRQVDESRLSDAEKSS